MYKDDTAPRTQQAENGHPPKWPSTEEAKGSVFKGQFLILLFDRTIKKYISKQKSIRMAYA